MFIFQTGNYSQQMHKGKDDVGRSSPVPVKTDTLVFFRHADVLRLLLAILTELETAVLSGTERQAHLGGKLFIADSH